jgi:serine/threonine protein kinase
MAATPPFEQALLGQTLAGKYRLVEVQGAGFYSVVFVAHQHFCNRFVRPVAIKVSRQTGLTEDTAPDIFGDALVLARLLANSDHEGRRHLVQIHDMGLLPDHEGRAYLVMEYVDGLPLMTHMAAQGRVPAATGLRVFKQICQAMALVHEQGAIHRDLIPENILVDRKGAIRVVDFGLAAYADPHSGFVPGATGTYCYMAPETMRGRSTAASDVYSVGLVVYQLFTGGGPHLDAPWVTEDRPSQAEDNLRIKTALRFPPVSDFHNEVRNEYRWLDALLARCLDTHPHRRFANAMQLLAAIEACEAGMPVPEAPPPPPAEEVAPPAAPRGRSDEEMEALFREARRLLGSRSYDKVIDRLDIHRPAEWAVLDVNGARALRFLGQAYLGRGEARLARECLEQLRNAHREHAVLVKADYAAVLSDLHRCYRALGLEDLARACQEEARGLM